MKKIVLSLLSMMVASLMYGQLKVSANGHFGTTSNVPLIFDVNNVRAGNTGSFSNANVSFGYQALSSNTSGTYNTASGHSALKNSTTGQFNTAFGANALISNLAGNRNTAIGEGALLSNVEGRENTAIGNAALRDNIGDYDYGSVNTAVGAAALVNNTTGSGNTAIGIGALSGNTTGSGNIAIGYWATVEANNLSNAIAIGKEAIATASNQIRMGNTAVSSIGGYSGWTTLPSDRRAKKNIQANVPGLSFINSLQPVTYNLDLDAIDRLLKTGNTNIDPTLPQEVLDQQKAAREAKEKVVYTGFVAQDVEEVAKRIGYDFSGVDVDGTGMYGLRYAEFVVPLAKAVQELSEQNERLQAQLNELTELVLQGKDLEPSTLIGGHDDGSATGLQDVASNGASLQQNSPNPFSQSTVIRYTLPQTDKPALLVVSSMEGQIVLQIPLPSGEAGSITIEGGSLSAGLYYYSLYVGGSLVDTKKMILTK
jgi:hypothetical protein